MKNRLKLFLGGKPADFGGESLVLFNYTQDELSNPTIVENSYSQNVTLPATPANNGIFEHFIRSDHRATAGGFNPLARMPFVLMNDKSERVESGYAKLTKVARRGGDIVSYDVSLFGGLGSFFYALSYNEDGDALTLADLTYKTPAGTDLTADSVIAYRPLSISHAFAVLGNDTETDEYTVVNFAPMYNGLPEDFDADRTMVKPYVYSDIQDGYRVEGVSYIPKTQDLSYIVKMANKHTDWEMSEMRCYLLRPVLNVKKAVEAIARYAASLGFTLNIDADWDKSSNKYYRQSWYTLGMSPKECREDGEATLGQLLTGTPSPAQFLIGVAKTFGLCFTTDGSTVTMLTRNTFFGQTREAINLSKRIDLSRSYDVTPLFADTKYYDFSVENVGEYAKLYRDANRGREYGSQRVNTGYEFSKSAKNLLRDYPFKGAVDRTEDSALFIRACEDVDGDPLFPVMQTEECKARLYKYGDFDSAKEISIPFIVADKIVWDADADGMDWIPRIQMHDAENKAADGSGVFCFFVYKTASPQRTVGGVTYSAKKYYLTDWNSARVALNEGKDCWDSRQMGLYLTQIPIFRRNLQELDGANRASWHFSSDNVGIYLRGWDAYITDRYNADTRVLSCYVDISGLVVGEGLLRRFWWYDNAMWVLNRISNADLASREPVQCEFIKVQDTAAYTDGQDFTADAGTQYYLRLSASSFAFAAGGETKTLGITSNDTWTITGLPAWLTVTITSGTGNGSVNLVAAANSGSARSATIAIVGAHAGTEYVTVGQATGQVYGLSLAQSSLGIDSDDTDSHSIRIYKTGIVGTPSVANSNPAYFDAEVSGDYLVVSALEDNFGSARSATITISLAGYSATLNVTQYGVSASISTNLSSQTIGGGSQNITGLRASSSYAPDYVSVSSNRSWCRVVHDGGQNPYNFHLVIDANGTGSARSATITISTDDSGLSITRTITQSAVAAVLTTDFEDIEDDYAAHNYTGFTASSNYAADGITVTSDKSWAVVTKSGSNPASFSVAVSENSGSARTATITIETTVTGLSRTFTIVQNGRTYSIVLSPTTLEWAGNETQTKYIGVTTDAPSLSLSGMGDNFTAIYQSSQNRIAVTPVGQLLSGSTKTANLSASYGGTSAVATLRQTAFTASLTTTLVANSNVPQAGAQYDATAESTLASDSLSVSADQDWMHVETEGDNPVSFSLTFDENPTTSTRSGIVTITADVSGKTVTRAFTQARKINAVSIEPTSATFPAVGGSTYFDVTANCPYLVEVEAGHGWCTIVKSGDRVTVTAIANGTYSDRNATVYVRWTTSNGQAVYESFHVLQAGLSVTPISIEYTGNPIAATGGYLSVQVTADGDWSINSAPAWISRMEYQRAGDWVEFGREQIVSGGRPVRIWAGSNVSAQAVQREGSIVFADDYGNTATARIVQNEAHPAMQFSIVPLQVAIENWSGAYDTITLISPNAWEVESIVYKPYEGEDAPEDGSRLLTVTPMDGPMTTTVGRTVTLERVTEQEDESWIIQITFVSGSDRQTVDVFPNDVP